MWAGRYYEWAAIMNVEYVPMGMGADWDWFNRHNHVIHAEDTTGILARDVDTHERYAACVMDNWTANSVQSHLVIVNNNVIRHKLFETFFHFVFVDSDRKYVYGMVPSDNKRALKLNVHLGFTERIRLPDAFADGVDYVVMELKRQNCRFIHQAVKLKQVV